MFRANFQRTGVYNLSEVQQFNKLKWQCQKFPEISNRCLGLTVGEGIVCVASKDRNLYGLDANNGQELWIYQLGEKVFSSPVIYDGIFYVNSIQYNNTEINQYLRAIDVKSGQLRWQLKLDFQPLSLISTSIPSSPVISEGIIYIGGTDGNLYGIDICSGELVWSFKTTKNMPLTPPAVKDKIIFVASADGYLYAIDIETKEEKWRYEIGSLNPFVYSFPAISNQAVYIISGDNTFYAIRLQTGELLWSFKNDNISLSVPIITENIIYVASFNSSFLALDVETGQTLFNFPTQYIKNNSYSVLVGNIFYIGGQGFLEALDLNSRKEIWRFTIPLPNGLRSKSYFWLKKLGQIILTKLFKFTFYTENFSTPIIDSNVMYVCCRNGYIYALDN